MTKWNVNRRKQPDNLREAATDSTPNPGDFSLGCLESRAAARAMLKEKDQIVIQVDFTSKLGAPLPEKPFKVNYWSDGTGRTEYYRDSDFDEQETEGRPS